MLNPSRLQKSHARQAQSPKPKERKWGQIRIVVRSGLVHFVYTADIQMIGLVVFVPQAGSDGTQRQNFKHSTPFSEVLDTIHEIIGCLDVAVKPKLAYKLSTAAAKADAVNLSCEEDWEGCLEEKAGTVISVKIQVTAQVSTVNLINPLWANCDNSQYMALLLAKKGKSTATKKKGNKIQILDLEHAVDGEDDFDEGLGTMADEMKFMEQLQRKYAHCQACGPLKVCKIGVSGQHHPLSHNQLSAWAKALSAATHGVTLVSPPKARAFSMFFKSSMPSAPEPPNPFAAMGPYNPYMLPAPWMPQHTFANHSMSTPMPSNIPPNLPEASTSKLPSSDLPELGGANPYPEIDTFILKLSEHQPKRNLIQYLNAFSDRDFFHIDELSRLGTAEELTRLFGMSMGNAAFVLEQIKYEMKRVDRANRAGKV
ncbi:hypothetical protein C8J57DRAFT_1095062 [Mycena rebaudengoi]|nr:hypothetical protein C8J57DRAFT_1095062 [Mycena rebaudengoi]